MFFAATIPPRTVTLAAVTGISALSFNMFVPSLPSIAADLRTDYRTISLSIAAYLAVTGALQLIVGPLSDRFGRRPVLLGAFACFVTASLGCVLATDVRTFFVFRILQAAIVAGAVLSRAVIRDMATDEKATRRMASVASIMAVAPMLGPMIGGMLEDSVGWRWSFALYTFLGVSGFLLCWIDLGETKLPSPSSLVAQFRAYPELLGSGRFMGHTLCLAFGTSAFFAFVTGVPLVGSILFEASSVTIGLSIGSITAGFGCGSILCTRLAGTLSTAVLIVAGRVFAIAGPAIGLGLLGIGIVHPATFFGTTILVGFGNGLTMPGSTVGALSVRSDLAGSASGFFGAATVLAGAIVTSVTASAVSAFQSASALLGIMLLCAAVSLAGAALALACEGREPTNRV